MNTHGSYYLDLIIASCCRGVFFLSFVAVLAIMTGCGSTNDKDPRSFTLNGRVSADTRPLVAGSETSQTRNQQPIVGADEKSDSSLTKPPK